MRRAAHADVRKRGARTKQLAILLAAVSITFWELGKLPGACEVCVRANEFGWSAKRRSSRPRRGWMRSGYQVAARELKSDGVNSHFSTASAES
jgi:hypothetical protein